MVNSHVHVYTMGGRCIRSEPMSTNPGPADNAARAGVPGGLRQTLLDMGLTLTDWAAGEGAGLASRQGEQLIIRIKPMGLVRDMRSTTVTLMAIRRDGVEIDAMEAWQARAA